MLFHLVQEQDKTVTKECGIVVFHELPWQFELIAFLIRFCLDFNLYFLFVCHRIRVIIT